MFLFGILALVMVMLWDPINEALQSSSIAVGVVFIVMVVAGILAFIMGTRTSSRASTG